MPTQRFPDGTGDLQRQARALGDPTRHAVFRYVEASAQPVTVAELAEHFGFNHNAIRQHLAQLREAGLVVEEVAPPVGRGRRSLRYRPAPAVSGPWGGESPYEKLALLLLGALRSGRSPHEVGYDAGRSSAGGADESAGDRLDALEALVAAQGFAPRRVENRDGAKLVLERCPYASAAETDPEIVCELHRGLVEGMTAVIGGGLEMTGLIVHNPRRAGCRLQTASARKD